MAIRMSHEYRCDDHGTVWTTRGPLLNERGRRCAIPDESGDKCLRPLQKTGRVRPPYPFQPRTGS